MADIEKPVGGAPTFNEIGTSGLNAMNGRIYEEFVPRLQWPRAGEIFKEMSWNDPVITAILLCSRQLIRNVTWEVEPASDSLADKEAAEFLRSCMHDMSITWSDFVDDVTSLFEYGFSYHEIVYKKREGPHKDPKKHSAYSDGKIGWRRIAGRSQTSIVRWEMDDTGGIQGAWQALERDDVLIPIEKALLFKTTYARGSPEGRSFLRGAYRPWYFKKHIEEIEGIGIERDLAGLPALTTPEGVDLSNTKDPKVVEMKNLALKMVSSIRRDRNEGIVLPYGWNLELLSSASNRQFDTSQIISRYDQRIAITMLADIVMLGADKVGSFALARVKQDLLAASLGAQLANMCDVFNSYAIPRLFAYNTFTGITGLPKLKSGPVIAPDLKELGDYIARLSGAKMPLFPDTNLENYLRRAANLPDKDEDAEYDEYEDEEDKPKEDQENKPREGEKEEDEDESMDD